MILGTVGGVLFALGMCMALIPEWDAFKPGLVFGCVGLLLGIITLIVWRKMEHKAPIKVSGKTILMIVVGILGALALGVGMCFCMVWGKMVLGGAKTAWTLCFYFDEIGRNFFILKVPAWEGEQFPESGENVSVFLRMLFIKNSRIIGHFSRFDVDFDFPMV